MSKMHRKPWKIADLEVEGYMWLIGIDVECLYKSIPHSCKVKAVEFFLNQHYPRMEPQNKLIIELPEFTLMNNFSKFSTKYYEQIKDTSVGAPCVPAYSRLHLGLWEIREVYGLSWYLSHVHTWLRYIDNVCLIWNSDIEELHNLIQQLN